MPGTPQLDDLVLASTSRTSLVGTYWFGYRVRETFRTIPSRVANMRETLNSTTSTMSLLKPDATLSAASRVRAQVVNQLLHGWTSRRPSSLHVLLAMHNIPSTKYLLVLRNLLSTYFYTHQQGYEVPYSSSDH